MRRILRFSTDVFWGMAWVGLLLAVLLFVLHVLRGRVGGPIGSAAATVESAITPRG